MIALFRHMYILKMVKAIENLLTYYKKEIVQGAKSKHFAKKKCSYIQNQKTTYLAALKILVGKRTGQEFK